MNSGDIDKSWGDLVSRANAESPRPAVDVGQMVRRRLETGSIPPVHQATPGVLDEIADLIRGIRGIPLAGAASAAILLLAWQTAPAIREVVIAIDLQRQLLAEF